MCDACNLTAPSIIMQKISVAVISEKQKISSQGTYLEVLHMVFTGGKGEYVHYEM